jgi:hypothetical protein
MERAQEIFNHNFVEQVTAMEARADALGFPGKLRYACPWECGTAVLDEGAGRFGRQASYRMPLLPLHRTEARAGACAAVSAGPLSHVLADLPGPARRR